MSEYNPDVRCAECNDEDASMVRAINVSFSIPVWLTQEHQGRLVRLVDSITDLPCNQPKDGVHWMFGIGAQPIWREPEEPEFNHDVFFIETTAREFVSEKERQRKEKRRSRPVEQVSDTSKLLSDIYGDGRISNREREFLAAAVAERDRLREALEQIIEGVETARDFVLNCRGPLCEELDGNPDAVNAVLSIIDEQIPLDVAVAALAATEQESSP